MVGPVGHADDRAGVAAAGRDLPRTTTPSPKEAYGRGVDGTWFAATPTGAKAQGSSGSSSNGY
ncbi:hypothetical protein ACWFRM_04900 [Streptomyces sp. NPDC055144]